MRTKKKVELTTMTKQQKRKKNKKNFHFISKKLGKKKFCFAKFYISEN